MLVAKPAAYDSLLREAVTSGNLSGGSFSGLRWPNFSDCKIRVRDFYEPTDYSLAWTSGGSPTVQAKAIIAILEAADAKGLNSDDYDGPRWAARLAALSNANPSESDLVRFDLAVTVSVMRYISDLHLGKVNPGLFHQGFDLEADGDDLAGFVRRRLVNATGVKAVLDRIEPPYDGYRRTEQALQQYLAMARAADVHPLALPKKTIEPGDPYPATAQLAEMLLRLGDLPKDAAQLENSCTYDGRLVEAVKHFQMRHGLDPDGRLGKATVSQLNTPLSRRIRQLQLAMERWRWVPHSFARPPIVVNIPEFKLRVLNESYRTGLEMKVVVGKAYRHQTPVFTADLKYVIFRPYWNVPLSIQRAELAPKLDQDRSYLSRNGYEVVTKGNTVVSTGTVDDETLAQLRLGKLRIRQRPGPDNALGLVKFLFPNEHDVYLHSTPATELFAKPRRDFSHGCIRVEKPVDLANWVLRDRPEWTPPDILHAMNGAETIQVTLDKTIPVLIVYATAVVLEDGEVLFFDDIYKQDAELERLLASGYPCPAWKPARAARPGSLQSH